MVNKSISEVVFKLNDINKIDLLESLSKENGNTDVKLILNENGNKLMFKLKEKRKIDRKIINSLKNKEISAVID